VDDHKSSVQHATLTHAARTLNDGSYQSRDEWIDQEIEAMRNKDSWVMRTHEDESTADEDALDGDTVPLIQIHTAHGKRHVDYGKIAHALWHLLVVLSPYGVEKMDGDTLTQEEVRVASESLRGLGLSVYSVD
jgi:hypothetical protein